MGNTIVYTKRINDQFMIQPTHRLDCIHDQPSTCITSQTVRQLVDWSTNHLGIPNIQLTIVFADTITIYGMRVAGACVPPTTTHGVKYHVYVTVYDDWIATLGHELKHVSYFERYQRHDEHYCDAFGQMLRLWAETIGVV